ncbi:MAG: HAMP domain-containing protein [Chloroflexi bacterium]|uniref:HAMP domain-containing sensor histidine kinase n=1 Tax=Candidatus Flexifilum breve TaxID=3140694 RepID=UPI0031352C42|nr:HAMP domain-containing protein [Chloroflexota bacterium]
MDQLSSLSLRSKLALAFGLIFVVTAVAASVILIGLLHISAEVASISSVDPVLNEVREHIQQIFTLIIGLLFIGLVITIAVSVTLSRYLLQRLSALRKATDEFARGNFQARIPVSGQDEFGSLSLAYNDLASQLSRHIKQLEQARATAEEATRLKDMFLATMSHELRTPLNAIIGFLHLMMFSGQMSDDNLYMAERALANTQRLHTLINNILDLSRITTGGLELVSAPVAPRALADTLHKDLRVLAHSTDLRFELEVDPALPDSLQHDEQRITQIVTNLVGNAFKFTETGVVNLSFRRHADRLRIQVTDTGIGISEVDQARIFDDFFQVDSSSTRMFEGAGLGLAIVRRLTLLMNGSINLTSQLGVGSTFTVDLPLNLPRSEPKTPPRFADQALGSMANEYKLAPLSGLEEAS